MEHNVEEESGIKISDLFGYLKKNILLFLIVGVCVFAVGLLYSFVVVKPQYKSTATFVVAVRQNSSSSSNGDMDYVNSLRMIETVGTLVTEDVVLDAVAEEYSVSKTSLSNMVSVSYKNTSYIISVSVLNHDRVLSMNIANALVTQLINVANNYEGFEFLNGAITATSSAKEGTYSSPNKTTSIIVSFVAGLVAAVAAIAIKELASTKFRSKKDVETLLDSRVIGYFPDDKKLDVSGKNKKKSPEQREVKAKLVVPNLKNYELYNSLLNNIRYSDLENPNRAIMVTSSHKDELKSTISCNLAACMAFNGRKVIIVDFDLRRPIVHKVFKVSLENGLVDLFDKKCELKDIIKKTEYGVDVITVGKRIGNPMAILGHKSLKDLIAKLKSDYEYVIIDVPPVLACADASAIAPLCDGVVFNVAMRDVRKRDAIEALSVLKNSGAKIIGVNITKGTEGKSGGGYYGGYGYGYGYYAESDSSSLEIVREDAATDSNSEK